MIPIATLQTIKDYVEYGIIPGSFVRAVLENNLSESFGRADIYNRAALFEIVQYVYSEIPHTIWGSKDKVDNWLAYKRKEMELKRHAAHERPN